VTLEGGLVYPTKDDLPEPNRAKLVELLDGRLADVEAHLQAES
jgi:hypothetical protein